MLTALLFTSLSPVVEDRPWQFVRPTILSGISGMALVSGDDSSATYLIVHDNKKEGQGRAAVVVVSRGGSPTYRAIRWEGDQPVDLEALTTIPGQPNRYIAVASEGKAYEIVWTPTSETIRPNGSFTLPKLPSKGANIEGFTVATVGNRTLAVWGHRGSLPDKGILYWSELDSGLRPQGATGSLELNIPWPAAEGSRGVSDLKLDPSGALFVSAAADSGDDGPFQSVIYLAGVFQGTSFVPAEHARLFWTDQHKIEAFDLRPGKTGGLIAATDDENLGASIWTNFWPW